MSGIKETTVKGELLLCLQQNEKIGIICLSQGQMLSKRVLEASSVGKNHRTCKVGRDHSGSLRPTSLQQT